MSDIFGVGLGSFFAYRQTTQQISLLQRQLSSGSRLNGVLDGSNNFVLSTALKQDSIDLTRKIDAITDQLNAVAKVQERLDELKSATTDARSKLADDRDEIFKSISQITTTGGTSTPTIPELSEVILDSNPLIYLQLDETEGLIKGNSGATGSDFQGNLEDNNGQAEAQIYQNTDKSAQYFDNNAVTIAVDPSNRSQRAAELTFQAEDTNGIQVLYDEGGTNDGLFIYLQDDTLNFVAKNNSTFGTSAITVDNINAGETYNVGFSFDSDAGTFTAFVNGQQAGQNTDITSDVNTSSSLISIGNNYFNVGLANGGNINGNGNSFTGYISDVAIYNDTLSLEEFEARFESSVGYVEPDPVETEGESTITTVDFVDEPKANRSEYEARLAFEKIEDFLKKIVRESRGVIETDGFLADISFSRTSGFDFTTERAVDRTLADFDQTLEAITNFEDRLNNIKESLTARSDNLLSQSENAEEGSLKLQQIDEDQVKTQLEALKQLQLGQNFLLSGGISSLQGF
jgi:hypothetical protein